MTLFLINRERHAKRKTRDRKSSRMDTCDVLNTLASLLSLSLAEHSF